MVSTRYSPVEDLRLAIGAIPDPEIPVITIEDLGILRDVELFEDRAVVTITPTYSGCPAMDVIRSDIERIVTEAGLEPDVRTVYAPAWTTDWMSDAAKQRLSEFGIAPPVGLSGDMADAPILCPQCAGQSTTMVSRFASTACKALMVCGSCREPFDYFKVH